MNTRSEDPEDGTAFTRLSRSTETDSEGNYTFLAAYPWVDYMRVSQGAITLTENIPEYPLMLPPGRYDFHVQVEE